MLDLIKLRKNHGFQTISDIKNVSILEHRGLPILNNKNCIKNCKECFKICATKAISCSPLKIDLGKCIFCGDCERVCLNSIIKFTNFHKLGTDNRNKLIIDSKTTKETFNKKAINLKNDLKKLFGRSLKLREVSAGGCNGCEMELAACTNVNFDMQRFGIDFFASPRHADGIVITGPITKNMNKALIDAYNSTPSPKIVILAGTCAISGGLFTDSDSINRDFIQKHKIDLYIPGCPIHPLTFINAILDFIKN